MSIKIVPKEVISATNNIATYNNKISNDFLDVIDAINALNRNWDGIASDNTIYRFNDIKSTYNDSRYTVINSLVSLLKMQVLPDYEATESKISSVASEFK